MNASERATKMRYQALADKVIKNLRSRKFEAYYCPTAGEAVEQALKLIPKEDIVSWGGSETIVDIGLLARIKEDGYKVIDRDAAKTPAERTERMRQAFFCDTYLTSFNAVSEDGVLINIDGIGNRVAAIAYGPKSVVAVVGMNKVCKTQEGARERARTIASPGNAYRCAAIYNSPATTPCIKTGSCGDCKADDCICSYIVETRMSKIAGRVKIILVGESLGI